MDYALAIGAVALAHWPVAIETGVREYSTKERERAWSYLAAYYSMQFLC
jgi:hypothetical protein